MPDSDELASFRSEREQYRTQLSELKAERDRLLMELREALRQIEHWRTLAEYRERMLVDQREGIDRRREPRWMDYPPSRGDRRS